MESPDSRRSISEGCISCEKCLYDCAFLQKYGIPKDIAENNAFDTVNAFECSLCALCESVCPKDLKITGMFLEFRQEAIKEDEKILRRYRRLLTYERLGASDFLTLYKLPPGCDTVLFPGCEAAHTRPDLIKKLFSELKKQDEDIGIALDCCRRPSYYLGRKEYFQRSIRSIGNALAGHGIKNILTVCPSCYATFRDNLTDINVIMVYDRLKGMKACSRVEGAVNIIDPCTLRFEKGALDTVRGIFADNGISVDELKYSRDKTLCCGEGGATTHLTPYYRDKWLDKRKSGITGIPVTYCAGCYNILYNDLKTIHLLDILLGDAKTHRKHSVLGYIKRALLKSFFKKRVSGATIKR